MPEDGRIEVRLRCGWLTRVRLNVTRSALTVLAPNTARVAEGERLRQLGALRVAPQSRFRRTLLRRRERSQRDASQVSMYRPKIEWLALS